MILDVSHFMPQNLSLRQQRKNRKVLILNNCLKKSKISNDMIKKSSN